MWFIQFLKPTLGRIIVFIILGGILFITPWWWIGCCDFFQYQGLPFPVATWGGFAGLPRTFIQENILINIGIWYPISCLIVWIFNKLKTKT